MQPTLILVHGAVLNGGMWAPIAADLSRDYNVLTPDLPGHGSRAGEKFTLAAAVATLTDIAKQLAPAPIVLAGDSLGGYTSLAAAASLGDQLRGAVLGGCTMNFRGPQMLVYQAQIALTKILKPETIRARFETRIRQDFPQAATAILSRGLAVTAYEDAVEELRKVDFRAVLASFKPPLILVNGSKDLLHVLGEKGARVSNPRADIRRFAGVGHGVTLWRPDMFAKILRDFLLSLDPAGTIAPASS